MIKIPSQPDSLQNGHSAEIDSIPLPRKPYPNAEKIVDSYKPSCFDVKSLLPSIVKGDSRLKSVKYRSLVPKEDRKLTPEMLTPGQRRRVKSVQKGLRNGLVGVAKWESKTLSLGPQTRATHYTQGFGHLEVSQARMGTFTKKSEETLSSDAIKYEAAAKNAYMRDYNANLGCVVRTQTKPWPEVAGPSRLVMVRSGRADTPTRIEELLSYGAASTGEGQLQVDKSRTAGDASQGPVYKYQPVLITAMDSSRLKAFVGRIMRFFGRPGNEERRYLRNQQRSLNHLFGKADAIEREVDGKVYLIKRPLTYNILLSAQARSKRQVMDARRRNLPASQQLFDQLATRLLEPGSTASPAMRKMAKGMKKCYSLEAKRSWLRSTSLLQDELATLHPSERMALQALSTGLTNRSLDGKPQLGKLATGFELIHLGHAFRLAGLMPHVGCKSGQDRTITAMGCIMLADGYGKAYEKEAPFEPLAMYGKEGHEKATEQARSLFSRVVASFSATPVRVVRGDGPKGVLKHSLGTRNAHPFPEAFLAPLGSSGAAPAA